MSEIDLGWPFPTSGRRNDVVPPSTGQVPLTPWPFPFKLNTAPDIGDALPDAPFDLMMGKLELYAESFVTKKTFESYQRQVEERDSHIEELLNSLMTPQFHIYLIQNEDETVQRYTFDVSANFTGFRFKQFRGDTILGTLLAIVAAKAKYMIKNIMYHGDVQLPRITHVAIKDHNSDHVWTLPCPKRHHDIINVIAEERGLLDDGVTYYSFTIPQENQGFITSNGDFVTREEAALIATEAGQLKCRLRNKDLFSEDIW